MSSLAGRWAILVSVSAVAIALLTLAKLPGAFLLGAMIGSVVLVTWSTPVKVGTAVSATAMALVGCMIGRVITRGTVHMMAQNWLVFAVAVVSVIVAAAAFSDGRWRACASYLERAAVWGAFPGAASVMVFMSEAFGADVRLLVAFMQYMRVAVVAIVASAVARFFGFNATGASGTPLFAPIDWPAFGLALALAACGVLAATRTKIPAGGLMVPFVLTPLVTNLADLHVELPRWLLAIAYIVLGWNIGLRFTHDVVKAAARAFPRVLAGVLALIAVCGALSIALAAVTHVDALTAYLAMSPGGADTAAIIAASAHHRPRLRHGDADRTLHADPAHRTEDRRLGCTPRLTRCHGLQTN